ncbi:MAG: hypothetical protein GY703_10015 [Gammaproteobacteria bacterium]|nr:hypothetical protein [Gammaproteobacteria bacterium]
MTAFLRQHPRTRLAFLLVAESAAVLALVSAVAATSGVSVSTDGTDANSNAMLDVQSPETGDGKGLLIPRLTLAQRTAASSVLDGGLLDDSGSLRGGEAEGLLVYQVDGDQGFYYNTSTTALPTWVRLRDFAADGSIPMTGPLDLQANRIDANQIQYGNGAVSDTSGAVAIGVQANGQNRGVSVGYSTNSASYGASLGYQANGHDANVAIGYRANGYTGTGPYAGSVSVGYSSNSFSGDGAYSGGVAVGYRANARHNFNENGASAVAIGYGANAFIRGVAIGGARPGYVGGEVRNSGNGAGIWGYNKGVAVGYGARGANYGVGIGYIANGYNHGTAIGYRANAGNLNYSFAKGSYSRCLRYNEEWKGGDVPSGNTSSLQLEGHNKFGYGQANFYGSTTTGSRTELYLGGTNSQRFSLQDNSVVSITAYTAAINTVTGDSSVWQHSLGVKRRLGAATTALIGSVTTLHSQAQGGLTRAPIFSADTTNGSLRLQVEGVNSNTVKWNVMLIYSEVRE